MADLSITCDETIESFKGKTKIILTDFNEKKANCKT